MKNKLFIPKKCKVGFNLREDTYTGKLGYVIYHDGKVWRKENSWESWRQKEGQQYHNGYEQDKNGQNIWNKPITLTLGSDVNPIEFDNIPMEGFVLNKKVGGNNYSWNPRQTYTRVYDPRGFEFEITIPNLLYILQETNSIKGKGLEGEFVYSWDGKDLVLIPTGCKEYKESVNFTAVQDNKVSAKTLIPGITYQTKQLTSLIYLGKFNWIEYNWRKGWVRSKKFVFVNEQGNLMGLSGITSLSSVINDIPVSNYADLVDKFNSSKYCDEVSYLEMTPYVPKIGQETNHSSNDSLYNELVKKYRLNNNSLYEKISDNEFKNIAIQDSIENKGKWINNNYINEYFFKGYNYYECEKLTLNDGLLSTENLQRTLTHKLISFEEFINKEFVKIKIVLKNGKKIDYDKYK